MYGPYTNEELVGKAIKGKREQVFLATKFGIVRNSSNPDARGVDGSPEYIRHSVEGSLKRLGVGFVPYGPLGRGFLTDAITRPEQFAKDDYRRHSPRFQGENFDNNLALVEKVKQLAARNGCTPGQLALAWVLEQGDDNVPIPGTKHCSTLEQNTKRASARAETRPGRAGRTRHGVSIRRSKRRAIRRGKHENAERLNVETAAGRTKRCKGMRLGAVISAYPEYAQLD